MMPAAHKAISLSKSSPFLRAQSLLACHAGHVVIEQKIESEKEEIGEEVRVRDREK